MRREYRPLDLFLITVGFVVEAAGVVLLFLADWRSLGAILIIAGVVLIVRVSVITARRADIARRKLPSRSEDVDYRDRR